MGQNAMPAQALPAPAAGSIGPGPRSRAAARTAGAALPLTLRPMISLDRWIGPRSERIPGRGRRELDIADIGPETQPDAGADWNHDDPVRRERRHSEAADEIGRAVDAGKALIDRAGGGQAVDEHHRARALAAEVPTERRP